MSYQLPLTQLRADAIALLASAGYAVEQIKEVFILSNTEAEQLIKEITL